MLKRVYRIIAVMAATLLLAGCGNNSSYSSSTTEVYAESAVTDRVEEEVQNLSSQQEEAPNATSYIDQVVQDVAATILEPGMSEYERAKAAFDYMIASTNLIDPVGLDLWRIRGDQGQTQPSYVENRSLSVLLYGVGMCEDYAAAFTMLLRGMGLEAEYVPGLTYSTEGALVDHAWAMAKIDGVWYHLDCQLEDNISRHGAIRYRYFMKSDVTMAGSHRWGQNLIRSGLLTAEQNEEIAQSYRMNECPQDYPTPSRQTFTSAPTPDVVAIQAQIEAEFREYESTYGALTPLELNIVPPVFALEGYGPPD